MQQKLGIKKVEMEKRATKKCWKLFFLATPMLTARKTVQKERFGQND